jgi:hypothetical protein
MDVSWLAIVIGLVGGVVGLVVGLVGGLAVYHLFLNNVSQARINNLEDIITDLELDNKTLRQTARALKNERDSDLYIDEEDEEDEDGEGFLEMLIDKMPEEAIAENLKSAGITGISPEMAREYIKKHIK